jgi:hypothetical protein
MDSERRLWGLGSDGTRSRGTGANNQGADSKPEATCTIDPGEVSGRAGPGRAGPGHRAGRAERPQSAAAGSSARRRRQEGGDAVGTPAVLRRPQKTEGVRARSPPPCFPARRGRPGRLVGPWRGGPGQGSPISLTLSSTSLARPSPTAPQPARSIQPCVQHGTTLGWLAGQDGWAGGDGVHARGGRRKGEGSPCRFWEWNGVYRVQQPPRSPSLPPLPALSRPCPDRDLLSMSVCPTHTHTPQDSKEDAAPHRTAPRTLQARDRTPQNLHDTRPFPFPSLSPLTRQAPPPPPAPATTPTTLIRGAAAIAAAATAAAAAATAAPRPSPQKLPTPPPTLTALLSLFAAERAAALAALCSLDAGALAEATASAELAITEAREAGAAATAGAAAARRARAAAATAADAESVAAAASAAAASTKARLARWAREADAQADALVCQFLGRELEVRRGERGTCALLGVGGWYFSSPWLHFLLSSSPPPLSFSHPHRPSSPPPPPPAPPLSLLAVEPWRLRRPPRGGRRRHFARAGPRRRG